jgi:hypothetical protein
MPHIHLFEFEDLPWFPSVIRQGMVDYLGILMKTLKFYKPIVPHLRQALDATDEKVITDLCSGNGGPVETISREMANRPDIQFVLTDKFPNQPAWEELRKSSSGDIRYKEEPVDVMNIPSGLEGVLTMFSAVHHFRPGDLKHILGQVVEHRRPVAIFDSGDKHLGTVLGIIFIHPVIFLLATPFFKPFRWSRIFFTYLIPLIPLCTIWDGVISVLRLYRKKDLMHIAGKADQFAAFHWDCGTVKNKFGFRVNYLIGIPAM